MKEGFPLLTTKKMHYKGIITELLWFLRGDTNIKYLVDNGCNIWNGDAYKYFLNNPAHGYRDVKDLDKTIEDQLSECPTVKDFVDKIKSDDMFMKRWGNLGPIYGFQWRMWSNPVVCEPEGWFDEPIDQIQELIDNLKTNPDSRRLMVNAWNVADLNGMVLPPCHYGFQVWTRELSYEERFTLCLKHPKIDPFDFGIGIFNHDDDAHRIEHHTAVIDAYDIPKREVSLMWSQRSVDTGLGWPYNVASYALLLEIIGKMVNMVPGELSCSLGDCHIYSDHIEGLKEQLTRESFPLPTLKHLKTNEFYRSLGDDLSLLTHLDNDDFLIENYQSHPPIKLPLSN